MTLFKGSIEPATLALPIGILMLIVLMVLPIPTFLLDMFFVLNLTLSVAILMAAMNAAKPLDFSSFPSVLLFATLLRLALNVASTRIVLVSGHEGEAAAGQIIEAFGKFLIDGNFAVGLFVFIILLIINMVVVTKGAGRVSEVSARFTLDALPGKQMAIDSDIAAGLMTAEEAKARRAEVSTEADFYGAMDGASKFVKGDAIAALLILGINIIAGFCLGMISHGMSFGDAAESYITLAVGDALVAQVPALLLSIAAAVIVTRVADKSDLAGHIGGQFADPRNWLPVGVVLAALGAIPAMPQTIFLPAAGLVFWLCWTLSRRKQNADIPATEREEKSPEAIGIEDVSDHTLVTIEMGYGLVHLVDEKRGSPLVARITGVRKQLSQDFGFVVPQFRVRDSLDLAPNDYRITLGGVAIGSAALHPAKILAINTGEANRAALLSGIETRDPSFGCPAVWIDPADRDTANAEGYLTVDPATIIATHLGQLLGSRPDALLGAEEVRSLLDALKDRFSGLVESITPDPLTLAGVTRLLQALLAEGISLAHPLPLLSSLARNLQQTQDFDALIDRIRLDLGGQIVAGICPGHVALPVITLEAELESTILQGLRDPTSGEILVDPDLAASICAQISELTQGDTGRASGFALIVQPPVRRTMARLLKNRVPGCLVLSVSELPASQPVDVRAVVGAAAAPSAGEMPQLPDQQSEMERVAA